jgi:hypothetical protein
MIGNAVAGLRVAISSGYGSIVSRGLLKWLRKE